MTFDPVRDTKKALVWNYVISENAEPVTPVPGEKHIEKNRAVKLDNTTPYPHKIIYSEDPTAETLGVSYTRGDINETIDVQKEGNAIGVSGAAIGEGVRVMVTTGGKFIPATTGNFSPGTCERDVAGADEEFELKLDAAML